MSGLARARASLADVEVEGSVINPEPCPSRPHFDVNRTQSPDVTQSSPE